MSSRARRPAPGCCGPGPGPRPGHIYVFLRAVFDGYRRPAGEAAAETDDPLFPSADGSVYVVPRAAADFAYAHAVVQREGIDGLLGFCDPLLFSRRQNLITFAEQARLPTMVG